MSAPFYFFREPEDDDVEGFEDADEDEPDDDDRDAEDEDPPVDDRDVVDEDPADEGRDDDDEFDREIEGVEDEELVADDLELLDGDGDRAYVRLEDELLDDVVDVPWLGIERVEEKLLADELVPDDEVRGTITGREPWVDESERVLLDDELGVVEDPRDPGVLGASACGRILYERPVAPDVRLWRELVPDDEESMLRAPLMVEARVVEGRALEEPKPWEDCCVSIVGRYRFPALR